jgi:hypothetical protein
VVHKWHPGSFVRYAVEAALIVGVIAAGKIVCEIDRRRSA